MGKKKTVEVEKATPEAPVPVVVGKKKRVKHSNFRSGVNRLRASLKLQPLSSDAQNITDQAVSCLLFDIIERLQVFLRESSQKTISQKHIRLAMIDCMQQKLPADTLKTVLAFGQECIAALEKSE